MSSYCEKSPPEVTWGCEMPDWVEDLDDFDFPARLNRPIVVTLTFSDCAPVHPIVLLTLPYASVRLKDRSEGEVFSSAGWHSYQEISFTFEVIPFAGSKFLLPGGTIETDAGPRVLVGMEIGIADSSPSPNEATASKLSFHPAAIDRAEVLDSGEPLRDLPGMTNLAAPASREIDLLRAAYAAFNARDIDAALALMTPDVEWPRAFKGGFVQGPEAIRAYWTEQWSEIDPHVEPVGFSGEAADGIVVEVHQVVRDLAGGVLADDHVGHRFVFEHGLIRRMEVCAVAEAGGEPGSS